MSFGTARRLLIAAILSAPALASPAMAEPAPPFAELLRQAQATAPRLAESEAGVREAEGLARQGAAIPNPTADVEVENFNRTGSLGASNDAETTFRLSQPLELGGKRSARVEAGRASVDAARARLTQARADFAFDLAAAYGDAEAADRRLVLAQDALDAAQQDLRASRALVDAGKEAELRSLQAQAAVTAARAALDAARAERATAFARLTALSGSPRPLTTVTESLLTAPNLPPIQQGDALAAPSVVAAEAEREAAARRVRVERTKAVPDVNVTVGVRRFSLDGSTALVGGVSMPIPVFDRNRGNISAAQAELSAAEARLNAARLDAEAEFRVARSQIEASQARVASSLEGERTAAEAYRLTRIGYEAGKASLLELNAARRALTDVRAETIAAQQARLRAEAAFARLQGRPLSGAL